MARPKPRLYRGLRDSFSEDVLAKQEMLDAVRGVYQRYGFVPLETPAIEFVDVLGKYLPEGNQPQGGIYSFQNPDIANPTPDNAADLWLALRYDLTASLARVVAQYNELQRPFRRYQFGYVWRHEKPGPGRFREFFQLDFDTVGSKSMAADAESCCVAADVMAALGFEPGQYLILVNNRKVLRGVLETAGLDESDVTEDQSRAATVLRAIDKLDRLGLDGVRQLLGKGRRDETGDFTAGAELDSAQIALVEQYLRVPRARRDQACDELERVVGESAIGLEGVAELREIDALLARIGYAEDRVAFDPTVVRGMGYYTGPVYEAVLTEAVRDAKGKPVNIGSIFGGGRYDGLVERFTGQQVPATGASVGIDRLYEAVRLLERKAPRGATADVLVTCMDKGRAAEYFALTHELRQAGISAEMFLGSGNIGKQLKYADKLDIPFALIIGEDEFERGVCQVKDLWLGRKLAGQVESREEWKEQPQQFEVQLDSVVAELRRHIDQLS
ncbi:MAG TPA: histidine--tRNA ligase [Firmicutes bacterium]|nr:histidine--tRNA ligase [Bacillota bacterium]